MLDPEKQKSTGVDVAKVSVVKTVCTALSLPVKIRIPDYLYPLVSVKFGVEPTKENYTKYLAPWHISGFDYFPAWLPTRLRCKVFLCAKCDNEVANSEDGKTHITRWSSQDMCEFCGASLSSDKDYKIEFRKAKGVSDAAFNFGIFTALTELGYVAAINSFLQWSDVFILETMRKLTEAVKPEIYNEVIKLYAAQREEQKNVG